MATVKPYTPAVPLQHLHAQSPSTSQLAPTTQSLPAPLHSTSAQTEPIQPAAPPPITTPPTYHPPTMQPTTLPSPSQRCIEWLNSPTPWLCTILSFVFGTLTYKLAAKALVIQVWSAWNDYYSTCQSAADHGQSSAVCDDMLAKVPAPPSVAPAGAPDISFDPGMDGYTLVIVFGLTCAQLLYDRIRRKGSDRERGSAHPDSPRKDRST